MAAGPAPTAESVGRMWSIQAPSPRPECSAKKDCPQAFNALRAAANADKPDPEQSRRCKTLNNPLPSRFHPNFDHREIQLLEKIVMLQELKRESLSISAITRRTGRSSASTPSATGIRSSSRSSTGSRRKCPPDGRSTPSWTTTPPQAQGPSPIDLPLHADVPLLDERGQGLLREAGPPPFSARRLRFPRRSRGGDSGLHRASQREGGEAVQMDGQPGAAHRRTPKRVSNNSNKPLSHAN